jgi:hypothetical protein
MPCQRVLALVTGAGPPQAAEKPVLGGLINEYSRAL